MRAALVLITCLPLTGAAPSASVAHLVAAATPGSVSMDVRDADLRTVVQQLATVGRVNAVMPDHVTGRVTLKVVDVPWAVAMAVVLRSHGLGMERQGNVVWVDRATEMQREQVDRLAREWCTPATKLPPLTFCKRP